jgi:Arc/MetJ-type ribon-helix-helix transcriptional regulator
MGTKVVPLRLDEEILSFVDLLVKFGIYSSRSEALRELIKSGIEDFEDISEITIAVDKLFELEREEKDIPVKLSGALKQLMEERNRF